MQIADHAGQRSAAPRSLLVAAPNVVSATQMNAASSRLAGGRQTRAVQSPAQ